MTQSKPGVDNFYRRTFIFVLAQMVREFSLGLWAGSLVYFNNVRVTEVTCVVMVAVFAAIGVFLIQNLGKKFSSI